MPSMTPEGYGQHSADHLLHLLNEHGVSIPRKDRSKQNLLKEAINLQLAKTYVEDFWKNDTKFKSARGSTRKPDGTKADDQGGCTGENAVSTGHEHEQDPADEAAVSGTSGASQGTESFFDTPSTFDFSQPPSSGQSHAQSPSIPANLKAKILAKREEWAVAHRDIGKIDECNALEEQLDELEKEATGINAVYFKAFKFGADGYGHKYPNNE